MHHYFFLNWLWPGKTEMHMTAPSYIWQQWLAAASGTFAMVLSNARSHLVCIWKARTNLTSNQRNFLLAERLTKESYIQISWNTRIHKEVDHNHANLPLKYFFSLCTSARECAITQAPGTPGALHVLVSTSIWKCRDLREKLIFSSLLDQRIEGNKNSALLPLSIHVVSTISDRKKKEYAGLHLLLFPITFWIEGRRESPSVQHLVSSYLCGLCCDGLKKGMIHCSLPLLI